MKRTIKLLIAFYLAFILVQFPINRNTKPPSDGTTVSVIKPLRVNLISQIDYQPVSAIQATIEAPVVATVPPVAPVYTSHDDLMAAAGIAPSDYATADRIVTIESSWNTYEVEPTTGACNLGQEVPCGKSGCSIADSVCELRWMNQYVLGRYGSWSAALSFHLQFGWY